MSFDKANFKIDYTNILCFRFALGITLIISLLLIKVGCFQEVYSPYVGLLGTNYADLHYKGYFGFLFANETTLTFTLLLACCSYLAMALNFYPLIASIVSYAFYVIIARRYEMVHGGFDSYFIVLLFLNILIALYYVAQSKDKKKIEVSGWLFALIFIQITVIYFFNGINKTGVSWLNGSAAARVLLNVSFTKPLAYSILEFPFLVRGLNFVTLIIEYTFPILLLLSFQSKWVRSFLVVFLLTFHWSLDLFSEFGHFKFAVLPVIALLIPLPKHWTKLKLETLTERFRFNFKGSAVLRKALSAASIIFIIFILQHNVYYHFVFCREHSKTAAKFQEMKVFSWINEDLSKTRASFFWQAWALYAPEPYRWVGYFTMVVERKDNSRETVMKTYRSFDDTKYERCFSCLTERYVAYHQFVHVWRLLGISDEVYDDDAYGWYRYYLSNYLNKHYSDDITNVYLYHHCFDLEEKFDYDNLPLEFDSTLIFSSPIAPI